MDRKEKRELYERQDDVCHAFERLLRYLPEGSSEHDAIKIIVDDLSRPHSGRMAKSIDRAFENEHFNFLDDKQMHDGLVRILKAMDV